MEIATYASSIPRTTVLPPNASLKRSAAFVATESAGRVSAAQTAASSIPVAKEEPKVS